jgi:hypothetical protein
LFGTTDVQVFSDHVFKEDASADRPCARSTWLFERLA